MLRKQGYVDSDMVQGDIEDEALLLPHGYDAIIRLHVLEPLRGPVTALGHLVIVLQPGVS